MGSIPGSPWIAPTILEMPVLALAARGVRAVAKRQARRFITQKSRIQLFYRLATAPARHNTDCPPRAPKGYREVGFVVLGLRRADANELLQTRKKRLHQTG